MRHTVRSVSFVALASGLVGCGAVVGWDSLHKVDCASDCAETTGTGDATDDGAGDGSDGDVAGDAAVPEAGPDAPADGPATAEGGGPDASDASAPESGPEAGPDGSDASTPQKYIFVSSELFASSLGGLTGADAQCQRLAGAAGLPGTYKAWLSTSSESADSRFTHAMMPYVLVDGTLIASDYYQLASNKIAHPIDLTESAMVPPSNNVCGSDGTWVWSSTGVNGQSTVNATYGDCNGWTSTVGGCVFGTTGMVADWSEACADPGGCHNTLAALFCVQQ
jgi:hypothetical protein